MITINKLQFELLAENEYDLFLDRMAESIAENFAIENAPNLKKEVTFFVEEAQKFDFETEETIEQYLCLKWKYPIFKTVPLKREILDILTFPDRQEDIKIDELVFYMVKMHH